MKLRHLINSVQARSSGLPLTQRTWFWCRHVINNADDVTVTLLDQSVYNAKVRCQRAMLLPPNGLQLWGI